MPRWHRRHTLFLVAVLVGGGLVLAACGRANDDDTTPRRRARDRYYDPCYANYYCYGNGWTDYDYEWQSSRIK